MGTVKEAIERGDKHVCKTSISEQTISDKDIIEAYKNCQTKNGLGCYNCPFDKNEDYSCLDDLKEATLDLLKYYEVDNKRLQNAFIGECILSKCNREKEIKLEAREEFAEKLKESIKNAIDTYYNSNGGGYYLAEDVIEDIDNIKEQMREKDYNNNI